MTAANSGAIVKYRYGEMTWREVRDAAAAGRVAILPVATIEDHGHHLPIDTDVVLCTTVCERGAALIPEECVLVPPVIHGYSPHHMDFPGTLSIDGHTFIKYVLDVTKSLAHHGFTRILIVNGHGSNTPLIDLIARKTVLETASLCAATNYFALGYEAFEQVRESDVIAFKAGSGAEQVIRDATELTAQVPPWLQADHDGLTAKVLRHPEREEIDTPVQEQLIVELYSK